MNIKKLFAVLAGVSMLAQTVVPSAGVFGAEYSEELQGAYNWAYSKGVTTMSSIDNANMYGAITRAEMAKMLSVYAESSLGITADTSKACTFTDIDSVKGDLHDFIIKSCQLGIMGQGITAFRPYDTLSRAEFGTALSRVLWGDKYEGGTPYYANHLNALKAAGIMNQIANAESTKEVRGYVMLMLQRSEGSDAVVDCDDPVVALACSLDTDECPAACKEGSKEDDTDTVVKSGDLDVTVSGESNGKLFIGRASDLDTITLKTSEEVTITKIVLEREGYSVRENIKSVWLEDENGAKIAEGKTPDSKGQVKLTLKKDYKTVNGTLDATVVVETYSSDEVNGTNGVTQVAGSKLLQAGGTVGFKVVDVESTAKNVNISGKANTYSAIAYDGSKISFTFKTNNTAKKYNWSAGESYEVAKFKINAPEDSSILLRGFTMKNNLNGNTALDLRKYFDSAEVTIAGEKVSGLSANVNKDDELVVTFKDVEIAAKQKAEVIVNIALVEDFDEFGDQVQLIMTDYVAVDGKVESRVSSQTTYIPLALYSFNGGKVKIENTKLGNVDVAQDSEDVVVAEGTITVPESVKGTFTITAQGQGAGAIKQMTVSINGEETDANPVASTASAAIVAAAKAFPTTNAADTANGKYVTYNGAVYQCTKASSADCSNTTWAEGDWTLASLTYSFTFTNVEIDKSGKIKFMVDTYDKSGWDKAKITFSAFKASSFVGKDANNNDVCNLKYDESGKTVGDTSCNEVSGSITFSNVTVQPAKASMTNSATKDVEFMNKETNKKVVFDGTYTAKKGDITLNAYEITRIAPTSAIMGNTELAKDKITFYVSIDGKEVANIDFDTNNPTTAVSDTFNNVKVKAGDTVKVKVEAEVEANNVDANNDSTLVVSSVLQNNIGKFTIAIWGEDVNGNTPAGKGSANSANLKVVDKGSITIGDADSKNTVLKKASDVKIASFSVKPSNGASETDLEEIYFDVVDASSAAILATDDDITVKLNNVVVDDCVLSSNLKTVTCTMNEKVESNGVTVDIFLVNETDKQVNVNNLHVNGKDQTSRKFKKQFVSSLVKVSAVKDLGGTTQFTLDVDEDDNASVSNFLIYFDDSGYAVPSTIADDAAFATEKAKAFTEAIDGAFGNGETVEAKGVSNNTRMVVGIAYKQGNSYVVIKKADFNDFFKLSDGTYARVFQSNK